MGHAQLGDGQVLAHGEAGEHPAALWYQRDTPVGDLVGTHAQQGAASERHAAGGDDRRSQPADRPQEGGLAHAVSAEQPDRACVGDHEVHASEHGRGSVAGDQATNLKHGVAPSRPPGRARQP